MRERLYFSTFVEQFYRDTKQCHISEKNKAIPHYGERLELNCNPLVSTFPCSHLSETHL